ncbi:uncharacterized protein LOC132840960 isoform X2 [Tachysurus vachellii]|uniref:uncharacterized protein LOC132840960 isoform X2 n=1 Tax=Tachysurus vachellii TaxID=175792 RepID=UPI00296ABEDA|nr:uncharacterized protein LOC132840960 isoform X2 [Tachysurus vachellii]
MELQQKHCVSLNVYDIQEQRKTEDIYQTLQTTPTLQTPPTVITRKASGKKITVPLLIINILLLTTILLVVGIHFHHSRQSGEEEVLNAQKMNKEMWYLHDGTFYLFWNNHSDCNTAYEFCQERRTKLATVTTKNREWLQSQINGKHMLVEMSQPQSSGDDFLDYDDMYPMIDMYYKPSCTMFGESSDLSEQAEGWVCASTQKFFNVGGMC